MLTPDGLADDVGRLLGPHEWHGVPIPVMDVVRDVTVESAHG
jgi:hypothetical protein